jgi:hypothetical protein
MECTLRKTYLYFFRCSSHIAILLFILASSLVPPCGGVAGRGAACVLADFNEARIRLAVWSMRACATALSGLTLGSERAGRGTRLTIRDGLLFATTDVCSEATLLDAEASSGLETFIVAVLVLE